MIRISQIIIVIAMLTGPVAAQTDTTFTYQGQLVTAAGPVTDTCDFQFWVGSDSSRLAAFCG